MLKRQALYILLIISLVIPGSQEAWAQKAFAIIQRDTIVEAGTEITLCIDSSRAYSNFIFSAQDPSTGKWCIWRKSLVTRKYTPVFNDVYNRLHVRVSADGKEMIYVRYRSPAENAMRKGMLDTAWICRGATNGLKEDVLFTVPQYNKNAIYDLDWSADKKRILFAAGNDQYPNMTKDGDIFEYNIETGDIVNRTNNWELWSNHCRYSPDGREFAYSHYANFVASIPTDIFIQHPDGMNQQITSAMQHINSMPFCTLTDFTGERVIYRRGQYYDNAVFEKGHEGEKLISKLQGFGGIVLDDRLYAATDLENNIVLFTVDGKIGSTRVSAIRNFAVDNNYNYDNNLNTHLNWLGKIWAKTNWSTGDTGFSIRVRPTTNTTYRCSVQDGDTIRTSQVKVNVTTSTKPIISKKCLTLYCSGFTDYQWQLNGQAITGATDSSFTPETGGNYTVTGRKKGDAVVSSGEMQISSVEAASLSGLHNRVQILPDPTSSIVKIVSPSPINMSVINEQGRIVTQQNNAKEFDMSALPDGSYSIMLYDDDCLKLKTRKIVLRK